MLDENLLGCGDNNEQRQLTFLPLSVRDVFAKSRRTLYC